MLTRSTSCDEGVQFDLACDGCGEMYVPPEPFRQQPVALWRRAQTEGWAVVLDEVPPHHLCPLCAAYSLTVDVQEFVDRTVAGT